MTKTLTKTLLGFLMILTAVYGVRAQVSSHPGVELYKSANYVSAIAALGSAVKTNELKANSEMWNYLGLAYMETKDHKRAVKSFEKAAKLDASKAVYRTNLAYAHFALGKFKKAGSEAEKAIAIDPSSVTAYNIHGIVSYQEGKLDTAERDADKIMQLDRTVASAYILKSHVAMELLSRRLVAGSERKKEAGILLSIKELLAVGKDLAKNNADRESLETEYDAVSTFYGYLSKTKPAPTADPAEPEANVTPLKILSKPHARYTDSARQSNVDGTIRMAVLFGADGRVKHTLLLTRLGHGLDESAIKAARSIIFEPKKRDGKPISVVKMVEYGFHIY